MITTFKGKNPNKLYRVMLEHILKKGKEVSPRGIKTKELYPCFTHIDNPRQRFLTCYGRHINPFFLCAEAVWILAGREDSEFIGYFNKQLLNYLDDDSMNFHGAYGKRIRGYKYGDRNVDQIQEVIKRLNKDNDTRQAVVCLWNPYLDNNFISNDYPCNNLSYFKIRDNKLHLHQIIRSNDINLGLFPTNVFQFTMIQEMVASCINVDVGEITFYSDSLHVYDDSKVTNNVINHHLDNWFKFDIYEHCEPIKMNRFTLLGFDKIIRRIIINTEEYMNGKIDDRYTIIPKFFSDVNDMLKIYCMRKNNLRIEAINLAFTLNGIDFMVSALEFMWDKGKNLHEKKLILDGMRVSKSINDDMICFITDGEYVK